MQIETYRDEYKDDVISLILAIQNGEAKIGLSLDEQPDLKDITQCYIKSGGGFWVMTENGRVIGTIGLMIKGNGCGVLKKFFVEKAFRCHGVGRELYETLLGYACLDMPRKRDLQALFLTLPRLPKRPTGFMSVRAL